MIRNVYNSQSHLIFMGDRPMSVIFISLLWVLGGIYSLIMLTINTPEITEKFGSTILMIAIGLSLLGLFLTIYIFQMKKIGLIVITAIFIYNIFYITSLLGLIIRGMLIVTLWKHFNKMSWGFGLRYINSDENNSSDVI